MTEKLRNTTSFFPLKSVAKRFQSFFREFPNNGIVKVTLKMYYFW